MWSSKELLEGCEASTLAQEHYKTFEPLKLPFLSNSQQRMREQCFSLSYWTIATSLTEHVHNKDLWAEHDLDDWRLATLPDISTDFKREGFKLFWKVSLLGTNLRCLTVHWVTGVSASSRRSPPLQFKIRIPCFLGYKHFFLHINI